MSIHGTEIPLFYCLEKSVFTEIAVHFMLVIHDGST